MRKFDPWPVFFRREFKRTWRFLVGFAVTGTIITKFSLGLTGEDEKNSPFAQRHKNIILSFGWCWYVVHPAALHVFFGFTVIPVL